MVLLKKRRPRVPQAAMLPAAACQGWLPGSTPASQPASPAPYFVSS